MVHDIFVTTLGIILHWKTSWTYQRLPTCLSYIIFAKCCCAWTIVCNLCKIFDRFLERVLYMKILLFLYSKFTLVQKICMNCSWHFLHYTGYIFVWKKYHEPKMQNVWTNVIIYKKCLNIKDSKEHSIIHTIWPMKILWRTSIKHSCVKKVVCQTKHPIKFSFVAL